MYNSIALSDSLTYCTVLAPIIAVETFLLYSVQAIANYVCVYPNDYANSPNFYNFSIHFGSSTLKIIKIIYKIV